MSVLVPATQVSASSAPRFHSLPSIEIIGLSSERVGGGPLVKHELSIEVTVSSASESGADELLDGVVRAVRQRLGAAEAGTGPISLASGEGALCVLGGTRWSISGSGASGVVRGASVPLSVEVSE